MQLSQKQRDFFPLLCKFFKYALNFEHFQRKVTPLAHVFPKLRTAKYVVRKISRKSRLRGPVDRRHGKQAQTMIQPQ